MLQVA